MGIPFRFSIPFGKRVSPIIGDGVITEKPKKKSDVLYPPQIVKELKDFKSRNKGKSRLQKSLISGGYLTATIATLLTAAVLSPITLTAGPLIGAIIGFGTGKIKEALKSETLEGESNLTAEYTLKGAQWGAIGLFILGNMTAEMFNIALEEKKIKKENFSQEKIEQKTSYIANKKQTEQISDTEETSGIANKNQTEQISDQFDQTPPPPSEGLNYGGL
jgi:hypothetical protein